MFNPKIPRSAPPSLPSSPRRQRGGVAVVEALISVAIIAVVIPAIYSTVLHGNRLNFVTSETFSAMAVCKEKIEELSNMTSSEITASMTAVQGNVFVKNEYNINIARRGLNFTGEVTGTRKTTAYQTRPAQNTTEFRPTYFDVVTEFTWTSAAKLWRPTTFTYFTRIYTK